MKKKAKAGKSKTKKAGSRKAVLGTHEAGGDANETRSNSFYWTNSGRIVRHLSCCGAVLTQDTFDVRPGRRELAFVRSDIDDNEYEYCCEPPYKIIKTNPKLIIRG